MTPYYFLKFIHVHLNNQNVYLLFLEQAMEVVSASPTVTEVLGGSQPPTAFPDTAAHQMLMPSKYAILL